MSDIRSPKFQPQSQTKGPAPEGPLPTILLVDDDPDVTASLERRFSNFHVNVIRRASGMQGMDAVNLAPDLIITDYRMPFGDGEDLLTFLKSNPETESIPVLILSGKKDQQLKARTLSMGAVAFIDKPVHYLDLFSEVSRHIPLVEVDWSQREKPLSI